MRLTPRDLINRALCKRRCPGFFRYEGNVRMNRKDTKTLSEAIQAILGREDQIIEALEAGRGSEIFSDREILETNRICIDFMLAVARSTPDGLRAVREEIERLRDRTLDTDRLIASHTHENTKTVGGVIDSQTALFDTMLNHPKATVILAGFGERFQIVVRSVLFAAFTDIRHQLESDEGKLTGIVKALTNSVTKVLRRQARDLRKEYRQSADSVVVVTGPRSEAKRQQVLNAALCLAKAKRKISILAACERSFVKLQGGYATSRTLFGWCHDNEAKFLSYVTELELAAA